MVFLLGFMFFIIYLIQNYLEIHVTYFIILFFEQINKLNMLRLKLESICWDPYDLTY